MYDNSELSLTSKVLLFVQTPSHLLNSISVQHEFEAYNHLEHYVSLLFWTCQFPIQLKPWFIVSVCEPQVYKHAIIFFSRDFALLLFSSSLHLTAFRRCSNPSLLLVYIKTNKIGTALILNSNEEYWTSSNLLKQNANQCLLWSEHEVPFTGLCV